MEQLLIEFLKLAGVGAFFAALINVGKYFGVIDDNSAPKISLVLSVLGFVAMVSLKLFAPDVNIGEIDGFTKQAADVLMYILGLFTMLGFPAQAHGFLKAASIPALGYSYSKDVG